MDGLNQTGPGFQAHGFQARCLLRRARWATLATQSGGQPFATLVTHAVAQDGTVLMLLSAMAEHSRHLQAEPRCAIMVTGEPENLNWQTAPRLTVTGVAAPLPDAALRHYWVARHPYARLYADFADFSLWRLVPQDGLFIEGFGQIRRLSADGLACDPAAVAAIATVETDIIGRCNTQHEAAINRLAHAAGGSGRWSMLGLDCDGFDLSQDESVLRLAFEQPVHDRDSVRIALAGLLRMERNAHFLG